VDRSEVPDVSTAEALKLIRDGVAEKDMDDIKAAVQMYAKAVPTVTYVELEKVLRANSIDLYLIGIEKPLLGTIVNMDLQGVLGKKFTVTYRFAKKPTRPRDRPLWPVDDDENFARLADGGEAVPSHIPKCTNCSEIGHTSRHCPQEKMENADRPTVAIYNCGETGHRIRDCESSSL